MHKTAIALLIGASVLSACARPLSPNEDAFAAALFGDTLERAPVRVWGGLNLAETEPPQAPRADAPPPRKPPEGFCQRKPQVAGETVLAAFVLYNQVWFMHDFYEPDSFAGWPVSVPLPTALIMVHELVHVWQWQNRERTGYSPLVSASESVDREDPYFWAGEGERPFLTYGFEQQAAIIEDYVCFSLFDRKAPRQRELRDLLAPVLPVEAFEAAMMDERRRRARQP